jgi:integrase
MALNKYNKPSHQNNDIIFLSVPELKLMEQTDCQKPHVKNAFLFSCYTGLRFSDVKDLTWDNFIDISGQSCIKFKQAKTGEGQYLPIIDKAKQYLPEPLVKVPTDKVFSLSTNGYTNIFLQSWTREAGITKKITFHTARHTAATLLLAMGENMKTISSMLGHSTSAVTERHYAAIQIAPLTAAMNKFNNI